MADIKQIKIGSSTYDIRDASIRKKNYATGTCIQKYNSPGIPSGGDAEGLSLILNYTFFGLVCSKNEGQSVDGITLLGMGYLPVYRPGNAWTTNAEIHTAIGYCWLNTQFFGKGRLRCTSTVGTCSYRGSAHAVTSSGNAGHSGYLSEVGGLF